MKYVGFALLGILALILLVIVFICVAALFVNPRKDYDRNSRFYRFIMDFVSAATLWLLRVRIHVSGMERVPLDRKCLYVGNHRSNFDSIVTWKVFRRQQLAYLSKGENFKLFVVGRIVRRCCFMAIDRENARNAMNTINRAARLLGEGEVSIGVYPEGTRSKTKVLLPFHGGVFKIAQKAKAPIVVLAIRGCEDIHKHRPFGATDVYLDVVDVMMPEDIEKVRSRVLSDRARTAIDEHLKKQEGTGV